MNNCPRADELKKYLQGDLPSRRLDELAEHLESCTACDELAAKFDEEPNQVVAMLRTTAGVATGPEDVLARPIRIGDYQILREVGRGGMGVVFQARHVGLNRLAAIKMILSGRYAGPEEQMRFRIEGEMLARLHHPNIVDVFETGQHEGRPFLALEWVDGGTLEAHVQGPALPAKQVAELVLQLAEAVQHSHQNGVLHRDLKPANVLLTPEGTPKITDFGLARPVSMDMAGLTATGTVLGTPAYMAPEQAGGSPKAITPAVDIYALGAILFALLTGRPPFLAESPASLIRLVVEDEPPPVSRFRRGIPADLEVISRHCLEKDPKKRYPTAAALAQDLRYWLEGRPLLVRPIPFWERFYRLVKRYPVPTLAVCLIITTIILAFVSIEASRREEAELRLNEEAFRRTAQRGEEAAKVAALRASQAQRLAEQHEALAIADRAVLRCEADNLDFGLQEFARAKELAQGAAEFNLVRAIELNQQAWQARQPQPVRSYDPPTLGFPIQVGTLANEGQSLLTAGRSSNLVKIWPLNGGPPQQIRPNALSFGTSGIAGLVVDPTGQTLYVAMVDHRIKRYSTSNWQPAGPDLEAPSDWHFQCLAMSHDGRKLAAGSVEGRIRVWTLATGQVAGPDLVHSAKETFRGGNLSVTALVFTTTNTLISSGRRDGVQIWDVTSGTKTETIPVEEEVYHLATNTLRTRLLIGGMSEASFWQISPTSRRIWTWPHPERVEALAISPDEQLLATGDNAGNARIWEAKTGKHFASFRYTDQVRWLSFAPETSGLFVGGMDGSSSLWKLPTKSSLARGTQAKFRVSNTAGFLPDGTPWTVCSAGLLTWKLMGERLSPTTEPFRTRQGTATVWSGAVSPNGELALTGGYVGDQTRLWKMSDHTELASPSQSVLFSRQPVGEVGFLPDNRTFFTRLTERNLGYVNWWRFENDKLSSLPTWPIFREATCLAPHPDGQRVLLGQRSGSPTGLRWVKDSQPAGPELPHPVSVRAAAVHPDGVRAVTGGEDGGVRIWNLVEGKLAVRVGFHAERINAVAWGPRDILATASDDGLARLWDARTMLPLGQPLPHASAVLAVAIHPEGKTLLTASRDGQVLLWDLRYLKE